MTLLKTRIEKQQNKLRKKLDVMKTHLAGYEYKQICRNNVTQISQQSSI